jgi:hypothetical protein
MYKLQKDGYALNNKIEATKHRLTVTFRAAMVMFGQQ